VNTLDLNKAIPTIEELETWIKKTPYVQVDDPEFGEIQHRPAIQFAKHIHAHLLTHGYREQSNLLDLAHKVVETQASNTMTHEQAADVVAKSEANIVQGYREQSEEVADKQLESDLMSGSIPPLVIAVDLLIEAKGWQNKDVSNNKIDRAIAILKRSTTPPNNSEFVPELNTALMVATGEEKP